MPRTGPSQETVPVSPPELNVPDDGTTDKPGWATNSTTKPRMIDRIKQALEADVTIPDEDLLRELRDQHWGEPSAAGRVDPCSSR